MSRQPKLSLTLLTLRILRVDVTNFTITKADVKTKSGVFLSQILADYRYFFQAKVLKSTRNCNFHSTLNFFLSVCRVITFYVDPSARESFGALPEFLKFIVAFQYFQFKVVPLA